MALAKRDVGPALVHHCDRGVQYAAGEYTALLAEHGASGRARAYCGRATRPAAPTAVSTSAAESNVPSAPGRDFPRRCKTLPLARSVSPSLTRVLGSKAAPADLARASSAVPSACPPDSRSRARIRSSVRSVIHQPGPAGAVVAVFHSIEKLLQRRRLVAVAGIDFIGERQPVRRHHQRHQHLRAVWAMIAAVAETALAGGGSDSK